MAYFRRKLREHRMAAKGVPALLAQLGKEQWHTPEICREDQNARLEGLIRHAYRHVPFYRRLLVETGVIDGTGQVRLERFSLIPPMDKSTIRRNFGDLQSDDLQERKWFYASSSGSTGETVRVIVETERLYFNALPLLFSEWAGYGPVDRQIRLWGSVRDVFPETVLWKKWAVAVTRWANNEVWLNSYRVDRGKLNGYVRRINAYQPKVIYSYADVLFYLANFIEAGGLRVHSPQVVVTIATPLRPHMRETIERVFKARVFDLYGSHESNLFAAECDRHEGLHVSSSTHLLEILGPDGLPVKAGVLGEIVVTTLGNYAMPLLRYRLGDMGFWSEKPCSCGRGWPLLREVTGRVIDVFTNKAGEFVSGGHLITIVDRLNYRGRPFIDQYQIIQEDYDYLRMLYRPVIGVRPDEVEIGLKGIAVKFKGVMGTECRVEFTAVEKIPVPPSGKFRFTISRIPLPSSITPR